MITLEELMEKYEIDSIWHYANENFVKVENDDGDKFLNFIDKYKDELMCYNPIFINGEQFDFTTDFQQTEFPLYCKVYGEREDETTEI